MSEVQSVRQEPQFAAFVGIDWADQKPVWSLQAVGSEERYRGSYLASMYTRAPRDCSSDRTIAETFADVDEKIEEAAAAHPDFCIFESLPGAGAGMAPRWLAAFGSPRERDGSADEVPAYTGIAPVTEKSGKKKWVHFRWACPKFLRQSFHEWAGHSIAHSGWARAYYQQQRSKGQDHHAGVRALAFKWIRVAFRCWKDGVAYEESKYLASLARRGSPLATVAAAAKTL